MLKSVSLAIAELMTNYERVLESVRDMQQNRTLLPWEDFNKILKTLSGVGNLKTGILTPALRLISTQLSVSKLVSIHLKYASTLMLANFATCR